MLNGERIKRDVIVLGASAGGIETLSRLFQCLPADLPAAIAVAHHPLFNSRLASVLSTRSQLPVIEPQHGDAFLPGKIYLAPRDQHMRLQNGHIVLSRGPKEHSTRPAVDPLFCTAAATYKERVVGVVLSGGGADGVEGLIQIKQYGGLDSPKIHPKRRCLICLIMRLSMITWILCCPSSGYLHYCRDSHKATRSPAHKVMLFGTISLQETIRVGTDNRDRIRR